MKKKGILLAATRSGSGKTLISCALMGALKKRGLAVSAFKCGPDYIDPMFHRTVLGLPSHNLDLYFTDEEMTRKLYLENSTGDISVIEGVMGLYDGVGGISEQASAYHLAKTLETPILLIVDARGQGRSLLAEIGGFLAMDTRHLIRGILLNRITESYCRTIAPLIEEEFKIPVCGCFPMQKELQLESRYLGLKLPEEIDGIREMADAAAEALERTVDIDQLLAIAGTAGILPAPEKPNEEQQEKTQSRVRIGIARDEAFCFIYPENIRLLEGLGAEPVYFSPLHDRHLPESLAGIILYGGYPELWGRQLAENETMRRELQAAIGGGLPSIAECGGFMYLHDTIRTKEGESFPGLGILPGSCSYKGKLVRFGYAAWKMKEMESGFLPEGEEIRGHEFHYYDSDCNGASCRAEKPLSGRAWDCVCSNEEHWWGFAHLYYPSNPHFPEHFLNSCRKNKKDIDIAGGR